MGNEVSVEFFTRHMDQGTRLNVYLVNKTMLSGKITDVDSNSIVLDKCLIFADKIISSAPENK